MNSFALLGYENGKADALSARPFAAEPPEHLTGKAATQSYIKGYKIGYEEQVTTSGLSFKKVAKRMVDPLGLASVAKSVVSPSKKSAPTKVEAEPEPAPLATRSFDIPLVEVREPKKSWLAQNWWIPTVAGVALVGAGAAYYFYKKK